MLYCTSAIMGTAHHGLVICLAFLLCYASNSIIYVTSTPRMCTCLGNKLQTLEKLFKGYPKAVDQMIRYTSPEAVLESGVYIRRYGPLCKQRIAWQPTRFKLLHFYICFPHQAVMNGTSALIGCLSSLRLFITVRQNILQMTS